MRLDSEWDLDPPKIWTAWKRRPVRHLIAATVAGLPLFWVVHGLMISGLPGVWSPVFSVLLGSALAVLGVLAVDGPWEAPVPVTWKDETLSSFVLEIPKAPRQLQQGFSQGGATAYVGWMVALLIANSLAVAHGTHGFGDVLMRLVMESVWALVGGMWLMTLVPLLVSDTWPMTLIPRVAATAFSRTQPKLVVSVNGGALEAGARTFHLGRQEQDFELREGEEGPMLALHNRDEDLEIEGCGEHLKALMERLETFDADRGSEAEVPVALDPILGRRRRRRETDIS